MLHVTVLQSDIIKGEKMKERKERINAKLIKLGKSLELDGIDAIKAKRTAKNVIAMALFTVAFAMLRQIMMPGGASGLYYDVVSAKDFQIFFRSLI